MKKLLTAVLMLAMGGLAFAEPQNPGPANPLAGYDKYELAPLAMGPPYAGQAPNEKARAKMDEYLKTETGLIVEQWNKDAQGSAKGLSLAIEPRIEKIKFIGGGARFWAGALAGDSYVVMKVKITEQPSGKVLADPEFYQRASAMSGAWTFGAQDNDMLHRIIVLLDHYLQANYSEAVGGPTGYDPK